jgi:hypothetical protein
MGFGSVEPNIKQSGVKGTASVFNRLHSDSIIKIQDIFRN